MDASPSPCPLPPGGEGGSQRESMAMDRLTRPTSLSRSRERAGVRVDRARQLRHGHTDAEALLWRHLRNRQMLGLKFRRQHPIGPYFADFACVDVGLVIELDGGQHNEGDALMHDRQRELFMHEAGFITLRFWNHEVLTQTDAVLAKIFQTLQTLTPTLSRQREREERNSFEERDS